MASSSMFGKVYCHKKFKFNDGTEGVKRFIVVGISGSITDDDPKEVTLYVVRTTSQGNHTKFRPTMRGCYNDERGVYKLDPGDSNAFEESTWIQFEVFEYKLSALKDAFRKGDIEGMGNLGTENLKELLLCMKYSLDIPLKYTTFFSDEYDRLCRN